MPNRSKTERRCLRSGPRTPTYAQARGAPTFLNHQPSDARIGQRQCQTSASVYTHHNVYVCVWRMQATCTCRDACVSLADVAVAIATSKPTVRLILRRRSSGRTMCIDRARVLLSFKVTIDIVSRSSSSKSSVVIILFDDLL